MFDPVVAVCPHLGRGRCLRRDVPAHALPALAPPAGPRRPRHDAAAGLQGHRHRHRVLPGLPTHELGGILQAETGVILTFAHQRSQYPRSLVPTSGTAGRRA